MTTAANEKPKPLLPPDEKFWQRYSPHRELPLAGVTSFFIHGLVVGILLLAALLLTLYRDSDKDKPTSHDVVQITGGGDGFEGLGGEPGFPGDTGPKQTEAVPIAMTNRAEKLPEAGDNLKEAAQVELDIPEFNVSPPKTDVDSSLANVEKEAANLAQKENAPVKKPAKVVTPGTGNPKGTGGLGGTGGGPGKGTRGSGLGVGGPGGRKATKAEIYAWRWRFDLTGNGREHATKLAAFGVTLAIPNPQGKFLFVQDLRRRPVDLQPGNLDKFKDAVKWKNTEPASLFELAKELKLQFVPPMVIMLLPQDREEKMAAEELRFAQRTGRPAQQIQATWFDFRLRDGVYEPVAIRQE